MAPLPSRWLPLLALLLGCSDATLGKRNDPPGVAIVSPGPGDVLFEGAPVELWVDVEDEAAIEELDYYWRVNPGGLLLGTLSVLIFALAGALAVRSVLRQGCSLRGLSPCWWASQAPIHSSCRPHQPWVCRPSSLPP